MDFSIDKLLLEPVVVSSRSRDSIPGQLEIQDAIFTCIDCGEFSQVFVMERTEEDAEEAKLFNKNQRNGLQLDTDLTERHFSISQLNSITVVASTCHSMSFHFDFWKNGVDCLQWKNARYGKISCTF